MIVELFDRVLSVRDGDGRLLDLGSGTNLPYASAQEATRRAIDAILRHLNILAPSGAPAFNRLPDLVAQGDLVLALHGHERETYVAALHLWVAYGVRTAGMPWPKEGQGGIVRVDVDPAASFYDTYRFETDVAPIERLAEKAAEWQLFLTEGNNERELNEFFRRVRELLGFTGARAASGRPERIRIGVLGVTGAGKSSFINALLQRYVVPRSEDICSSCIVELWPTQKAEAEHFVLSPLPPKIRQARLEDARKAFEAAERRDQRLLQNPATMEDNWARTSELKLRFQQLEAADKVVRRAEDKKHSLDSLERFVSVTPNDRVHELISKVRVYLSHPLLEHVIVVDTPGLRDVDEHRRRMAITELATLDGWLYLSEGNIKFNTSVVEDLAEIRLQANNNTGAIVLTKADAIGNVAGTLADAAKSTAQKFGRAPVSWAGTTLWCTARAPALAAEMIARHPDDPWHWIATVFEDHGVLNFANRLGDPCTFNDRTPFRPSRALMSLVERAASEPALQRGLRDYLLDLSFVPDVARGLANVVNEQAIRQRVQRGREALVTDANSRIAMTKQTLTLQRRHLENLGSLERMKEQKRQIRGSIASSDIRTQVLAKQVGVLETEGRLLINTLTTDLAVRARELQAKLPEDLHRTVAEAASGEMSGPRGYSIFAKFDAPLAAWCSDRIVGLHDDFCTTASKLVEGNTSQGIKRATMALVEHYTLHRAPSSDHDVATHESFWESFNTTLERMDAMIASKAERVEKDLSSAFAAKASALLEGVVEAARAPLLESDSQAKAFRSNLEQLERDLCNLQENIPGSREIIERRVKEMEQRLTMMEAFATALADGGPEPTIPPRAAGARTRGGS